MTRLEVAEEVMATCVIRAEPMPWLEAAVLTGPILTATATTPAFRPICKDLDARHPRATEFLRGVWVDSEPSWRGVVESAVEVSDDVTLTKCARSCVSGGPNVAPHDLIDEIRAVLKMVETMVLAGNGAEFAFLLRQMSLEAGRLVVNSGFGHLLRRNDLGLQWQGGILRINDGRDRRERGKVKSIEIQPLVSLNSMPGEAIVIRHRDRITIAVPCLTHSTQPSDCGLDELLGANRAQILRAIRPGITGNGLALATGLPASSISRHTRVLRDAGLIRTIRVEGFVQHSMTPLGEFMEPGGASRNLLENQEGTNDTKSI